LHAYKELNFLPIELIKLPTFLIMQFFANRKHFFHKKFTSFLSLAILLNVVLFVTFFSSIGA